MFRPGGDVGLRRPCTAAHRALVKRWLTTFCDLDAMFRKLDVNGDGFVDYFELQRAVAPYGPEWQPLPEALMAMGDANHDGKISFREFKELGKLLRQNAADQVAYVGPLAAPAKPPMAEPERATEPEPASSEEPRARHAPGDSVTVVRCVDPKTPACMERIGHTGRLLRADGKGRPYQVGFKQPDQQLWFWPADLVRSAPRGTKARGYLVPDEHSQKALERLGFDLRAPKSSFCPDPAVQRDPTYFGGAHISVLGATGGVATLSPGCYQQIHLVANYCRARSWRLPALRYHEGKHQPRFALEESDPHTRTLREAARMAVDASADGWNEPKQKGFHIGLYSSTLEQRPSRQQVEQMRDVLMKARWGFVLERNRGGNERNFFLDWRTWEEI